MERLAKLILVADYSISNRGMPEEKYLRGFGHDLAGLFSEVEEVAALRGLKVDYGRSDDAVTKAIIENLDAFADARRGRYANFASLSNAHQTRDEPIAKWWDEVAEAILRERYYGKPVQERAEANARAAAALMGGITSVHYITETRDHLSGFEIASRRTGQTELVQKWADITR